MEDFKDGFRDEFKEGYRRKWSHELTKINLNLQGYLRKGLGTAYLGYSFLRTFHFSYQRSFLPLLEFLLAGKPIPIKETKKIYRELFKLIVKDCENIEAGVYPAQVLQPQHPLEMVRNYPSVLIENYHVVKKRIRGELPVPRQENQEYRRDLPEYMDHKAGHYWSEQKAEIYEEQIEILFSGAGDAMRRAILPLFKTVFHGNGEGLRFLELGAGTGRMSRFMRLAFPKARITLLEVSEPFLAKARENLADAKRLDFVQGRADRIPFNDDYFDGVYCSFLFHEQPLRIRRKIMEEAKRVLKAGRFFGFVDCLQNTDQQVPQWALDHFINYLDQSYMSDYLPNPLEGLLVNTGFECLASERAFFSKAVLAKKNLEKEGV